MPFAPGENVGPYTIIEQLGQGGMATVFKAYHAALDRYVALKVLHAAFKSDHTFTTRFTREARIVAKLMHPNIVPVYDFAEHEGHAYLVMRYIEGRTLKARLEEGPLKMNQVHHILRAVGDALTYAHEQGVLHRDVKPSNVLLTDNDEIFLTDFGLARIAASGESTLSQDMMVGTPHYISPEQAKGERDLDARTDIYSLGVVLFEMLTGRVPFSADTPYAVIHDHIFTPLPLPTSIDPTISPDVERVLLKALAKEKDDRFASVAEAVNAFEQAVTVEPTIAAPPELMTPPLPSPPAPDTERPAETTLEELESTPIPPPEPKKKQRWVWTVAALALIMGCACCTLAALNARQKQQQQKTATALSPTRAEPAVSEVRGESLEDLIEQGDELARQGKLDEALAAYQQAAELDPDHIAAYLHAGDVLVRQENYENAVDVYQRAVDRAPENVEAMLKLALIFSRLGQWQEAGEYYQKAVELKPKSALTHAGLARYYVALGNLRAAREEMNQALELDPDLPEAHFVMGLYHRVGGRKQEAAAEFQFVLESPNASPVIKLEAEKQMQMLQSEGQ